MTRYITVTALIERDQRNKRTAYAAAYAMSAIGFALVITLLIGWVLTW